MVFSSSVRLAFLDKVDYYYLESFCGQKKGVEPIEKVSSSGCGSSSLSLSRFISIDCISPSFQFVVFLFGLFFKRMHPSPCSGYSFYDLLLGSGFRILLCNASSNCVYIQDEIPTQIGHASSETPFALLSDAVLAVTPPIAFLSISIALFRIWTL